MDLCVCSSNFIFVAVVVAHYDTASSAVAIDAGSSAIFLARGNISANTSGTNKMS
jgi:hypothetical protein